MKVYLYIFILFLFAVNSQCQDIRHDELNNIYLIKIDGSINSTVSDFVHTSLQKAILNKANCFIIELNTPGGLLKSTRMIVSDILSSSIPVVVYVSPAGSQSASAGVFITLAGNIAAMAPGTNIGASHPVSTEGKMDSVMSEKVTNDAAAFIKTISEKRKKNIQWAEDAVRNSVSITETEALEKNVIDLIANDMDDLLKKINNKEVETSKGKRIIYTENHKVVLIEMNFFEKFLNVLSDPNIAYILMMIGIWGIILEFYHPGGILPGVVGVISIVLGLYGLHTLPVNYAGFALILLAIILFIAEIKIISHGLLAVGGVISMVLGSLMLFDIQSGLEVIKVSLFVIITTAIIVSLLFIVLTIFVVRAHKRKVTTGVQGMIGEICEVTDDFDSDFKGKVHVHGELWNAKSDEVITAQTKVKIIAVENLSLIVKKI